MSENLAESTTAQKDYGFTKNLITTAYDITKTEKDAGQDRHIMAKLFVGDWAKKISVKDGETRIYFRGGKGYVPPESISDERLLEFYFIDVGQGDAILIQTPDDNRILIDGGKNLNAYSFIKWKYRLDKHYKDIDAIILTHGDEDHSLGLLPLLDDPKIYVRRFIHNGIFKRSSGSKLGPKEKKDGKNMLNDFFDDVTTHDSDEFYGHYRDIVDSLKAAKTRTDTANLKFKFECSRVDNFTEPIEIGKNNPIKISFVNPINHGTAVKPLLRKWSKDSKTINGNSVGVLIEYGKLRVLLCGDMNREAETQFIQHWDSTSTQAHVFKSNHHGSSDFSTTFLKRVQPWITVVSSGDDPDYGHPRANLLGCLGRFASQTAEEPILFSTELAATFKEVTIDSDESDRQLYEKTIHGMIYIRSNGDWVTGGRVYARGVKKRRSWEWEKYALDLATGDLLGNKL